MQGDMSMPVGHGMPFDAYICDFPCGVNFGAEVANLELKVIELAMNSVEFG